MDCPSLRPRSETGLRLRKAAAAAGILLATLALFPPSVFAQDDANIQVIRDTEIEAILHQDADPIFVAAGLDPKAVKLVLLGDKEINAQTGAGPVIAINTGLIMETKTPNELIGVIAHETGHAAGGHIARSGEGEKVAMRTFLLTMGLGILAAIAGAPDAGAALMYSSNYFATLDYLAYSRVQEAEADQAAATYMEKAGVSGRGLVEFFDKFRYEEVFDHAHQFPYFQSHPLSSDRIEALRVRVEKQSHYGMVDTPEALAQHAIMVAKLKSFINSPQQTFIDYKERDRSFPARYARAIAYYKATEPEIALPLIDSLIDDYPNNPYLYELKGQVLFEAGRPKDAEEPYRRSVALRPNAPLLQVNLGQTLVAEDNKAKLDEAIAHLKRALDFENDDPAAWQVLAQAYDSKGDEGMARLATAEQNFALGQMRDAWVFAMRAREMLPKDTPQWRRATDIVLVSRPGEEGQRAMSREGGFAPARH